MGRKMLGDLIESALSKVGITHELVEKYVWDCGCKRRKERFNAVQRWAEGVASNMYSSAVSGKEALQRLVSTETPTRPPQP
jgi:hypothetical protein